MGKHYPKEVKLEAIRMYYEEGMSQRAITEALGIRDQYRVKKWVKAYRREGLAAFDKMKNRVSLGRSPKKENTQTYIARLEMENALLKNIIPNCESRCSRSAISGHLPAQTRIQSKSHVSNLWYFASSLLCLG